MAISINDIVAFSRARTHLSDLVLEVEHGAEKIITKNGEPVVAMIDAKRLDHYHQLERAHIHLLLLGEAEKGWADIEAGRTTNAREGLAALKARRAQTLVNRGA
ncbi:MAG: type II toxin-antitoxin system Phd/YefM family antitoxin [Nevskiaceae bacterium]|nr:MAG: type II toxin-antitoxin system Phd/YefM family antitoxin [Nevskiaceae bacterium]TBR75460.1 MAG: type II toxin-antitoxin system Phd/YefM family antitoxin [Burkholderiaceae bacterium]